MEDFDIEYIVNSRKVFIKFKINAQTVFFVFWFLCKSRNPNIIWGEIFSQFDAEFFSNIICYQTFKMYGIPFEYILQAIETGDWCPIWK
jgi:hypothetical protein